MPRKALLCVLQLDVRSITCPGVLLKDKEQLYLSVSVLGQCKKTRCVPAVFPLLFHEKLVFEKAFPDIVDPGDLVELLELDTAVLELIQLVPPGEILATYEENTRDFLFPDPKLTCGHHGLDREILMKRSSSFPLNLTGTGAHKGVLFLDVVAVKDDELNGKCWPCKDGRTCWRLVEQEAQLDLTDSKLVKLIGLASHGIAPKLRFSTSSLITESLLSSGRSHVQGDLEWAHHSTPNGKLRTKLPKKNTLSAEKSRPGLAPKNYQQPTIASKSRSPSPYTKRRMCELSEEARQRLAHLNLGPYKFRRETDKPPFVVRRVDQPSPGITLSTWCPTRESPVEAWTKLDHDPSLLGSYRPRKAHARSTHAKDGDSCGVCNEDVISAPPNRLSRSAGSLERSAPPAFQKRSPSSVLNRSSLRERFSSGWPSPANGDEIHKRVKDILRTHSARQRLIFDESNSSKGDLVETKESSHKASSAMGELQSSSAVQQNATVHLDNGEYRPGRAAVYKGKPHRAIFEESLEKIYRNMYRKATGTDSHPKTHS